jgi:hypothetical protein
MGQAPWLPQQGAGGGSAPEEHPVNGAAVGSEPVGEIDPNDPRLVSESLEVAVDKDAYAQMIPPPDRTWRAKLKLEGVKKDSGEKVDYVTHQTGTPPVPFYRTLISASLIDPSGKFDGVKVYPSFGGWISTALRKDGSMQIATILSRLRKPSGEAWAKVGDRKNQAEWMALFVQALAGEPEIGVETQWQVSCEECGKEGKLKNPPVFAKSLEGMHRFPAQNDKAKRAAGELFDPNKPCDVNRAHGYSRAYSKVVRFLSLEELKGTVPGQAPATK